MIIFHTTLILLTSYNAHSNGGALYHGSSFTDNTVKHHYRYLITMLFCSKTRRALVKALRSQRQSSKVSAAADKALCASKNSTGCCIQCTLISAIGCKPTFWMLYPLYNGVLYWWLYNRFIIMFVKTLLSIFSRTRRDTELPYSYFVEQPEKQSIRV